MVCLSMPSHVIWQLLQADPEKEAEEGATELAVSAFPPFWFSDMKLGSKSRESKDTHCSSSCAQDFRQKLKDIMAQLQDGKYRSLIEGGGVIGGK